MERAKSWRELYIEGWLGGVRSCVYFLLFSFS